MYLYSIVFLSGGGGCEERYLRLRLAEGGHGAAGLPGGIRLDLSRPLLHHQPGPLEHAAGSVLIGRAESVTC